MDSFLREASSKILGGGGGGGEPAAEPKKDDHHKPSTTELMASAKVVADAAKAKMSNQEFDQGKAAEAAADILDGASDYGKLDETQGFGKMLNQAEDYLHKYSTTTTTTTTTTTGDGGAGHHPTTTTTTTTSHEGSGEGGGGGYGEYVKMAEGFLNKGEGNKSEGGEEKSGLMKMAGDFLKKN